MDSLFTPLDMYHFIYQWGFAPALDDWREIWVDEVLTFTVRIYSNTDATVLFALSGGKISRKQPNMTLPMNIFFKGKKTEWALCSSLNLLFLKSLGRNGTITSIFLSLPVTSFWIR